uniref:Uncharacterized protein n=1 Tax=Candidatus Kentrum sp. SD TaxID=2126332 RepID=A0A451BMM0_9GAMM|nr:MAG: hypothetical protein BECKSD772D_GA0070982_10546 [Candidatus Kentron sp. SD]
MLLDLIRGSSFPISARFCVKYSDPAKASYPARLVTRRSRSAAKAREARISSCSSSGCSSRIRSMDISLSCEELVLPATGTKCLALIFQWATRWVLRNTCHGLNHKASRLDVLWGTTYNLCKSKRITPRKGYSGRSRPTPETGTSINGGNWPLAATGREWRKPLSYPLPIKHEVDAEKYT